MSLKKDVTRRGGTGYPKIVTNSGIEWMVVSSIGDTIKVYFVNVHISYIWNYLPHAPSPTSILTWQWVMESCGDEWKIENGESKTKEECKTKD